MPEMKMTATEVTTVLADLEEYSLDNNVARSNNYAVILRALESSHYIDCKDVVRILKVCAHDLEEVKSYSPIILSVITEVLNKFKNGHYDPPPDLSLTALAIMNMIRTAAPVLVLDSLKVMCFETLLLYPDDCLIAVANDYGHVVDIINLYCVLHVAPKNSMQAYRLLHKLLKNSVLDQKKVFVSKNLTIWFGKVIPVGMNLVLDGSNTEIIVEVFEMLSDELVFYDYTLDPCWQSTLSCICQPKKYPLVIKNLLSAGSVYWHRLWIVFIKLLKHQITQSFGSVGTPINSLLPIVEAAFKLDVTNRCKAFECWNVLTDSFATETNESNINKRIKLLIIPLRSNNAKAEETALAKFKCWWHLIQKFQNKMDKFLDMTLVSLLNFIYGRHNGDAVQQANIVIPGQITPEVRKQTIKAIVDMLGHTGCVGCTDLPKLKGKLVTAKHLVDNWNHWIYSITSTVMMSIKNEDLLTKQQLKCLWKSFLAIIGELPENNIRSDLFIETMSVLKHLVQETRSNKYTEIILDALVFSIFEDQPNINRLLKVKDAENNHLVDLLNVVLDPCLDSYYNSIATQDLLSKFKGITKLIVNKNTNYPVNSFGMLLNKLRKSDTTFKMWTAFVGTLCESEISSAMEISDLLLYPLKFMEYFTDVKEAGMAWYTMCDHVYLRLKASNVGPKIMKYLMTFKDEKTHFALCVILAILKSGLSDVNYTEYHDELEILWQLIRNVESHKIIEGILPILVDRLVQIFSNLNVNKNKYLAIKVLQCFSHTLKLVNEDLDSAHMDAMINLVTAVTAMLKDVFYFGLADVIADDIIEYCSKISKNNSLKYYTRSLLKNMLSNTASLAVISKIKNAVNEIENATGGEKRVIVLDTPTEANTCEPNIPDTTTQPANDTLKFDGSEQCNDVKQSNNKENLNNAINSNVANPEVIEITDDTEVPLTIVKSQKTDNTIKETINESNMEANEKDKFTTPIAKGVPKKTKKKEPSIVHTVVENGEEYVVVKFNWKFNPRKLTENQKDKLKRKREDIPALYQDLSQSQDEFKLDTWKTDSQDTSNTASSKSESTSNNPVTIENPSLALKNMPGSNVVPKIMENFLSDNNGNKTNTEPPVTAVVSSPKSTPPTPKNTKSPRMALKDRVFRNVKNLIEKSSVQKENMETESEIKTDIIINTTIPVDNNIEPDKTEKYVKTPNSKAIPISNVVNSAPPLISADRPSRVKRKPKKFDDVELLALKKRRNSQNDAQAHVKFGEHAVEVHPAKKCLEDDGSPADKSETKSNTDTDAPEKSDISKDNNDKDINQNNENKNELQEENHKDITTDNCIKIVDTSQTGNPADVERHKEKVSKDITNEVDNCHVNTEELTTPKKGPKVKKSEQKSTVKKKKSRIESELAIDMVEGHPFLKMQSDKRVTRKSAVSPVTVGRRKGLSEKLNKYKSDGDTSAKVDNKKNKKGGSSSASTSFTVNESQENSPQPLVEELPDSEDVIESSQDSTISTVSVKATRKTPRRVPTVVVEKLKKPEKNNVQMNESQSILDCGVAIVPESHVSCNETKDIELSRNKTDIQEKSSQNLTENMDTEPMDEKNISDDVIIINDEPVVPLSISSEEILIGPETQELAEADTQLTDPNKFENIEFSDNALKATNIELSAKPTTTDITDVCVTEVNDTQNEKSQNTPDDLTRTLSESVSAQIEKEDEVSSSPLKNEDQRKKDFLNNTVEISPIKTMSPDRDKKSPSPDSSNDYVVIKLSSPVQSNGEPFDKISSPEFFTDDKISPDKRDLSPPRQEVSVTNTSPSSSLSLKKNRPQVRSGGRGAQMLGLCVPDKLHTIINPERNEVDDAKKSTPNNTTARRNLRMLYSLAQNDSNEEEMPDSNESENFLQFKKSLPSVVSSPSGPILKRKLADITDDATVSPASKRKRVSFHDPPVSTTISVQKYIEPLGVRSPQNSAQKRLERQMRQHTPIKSVKKLENSFKLDTVLTKAIESFVGDDSPNLTDDTQSVSLDETPVVEIVKASELNDSQAICPELVNCKDPVVNIASELSSPAMKNLLVTELEGKIETVGDLARMTELEVNRLCIKAPKIKVAKKVLAEYTAKKAKTQDETIIVDDAMFDETMNEPVAKKMEVEVQTECEVTEKEMQTVSVPVMFASMQTEVADISHRGIQTDESGSRSTADVIKTCLLERQDFVEELSRQLQESSIRHVSEKLPLDALTDLFIKKINPTDTKTVLNRILDNQTSKTADGSQSDLTLLRDYVCERFDSKSLILFCSEILQKVHDKAA